jgi:glycosyltransferase involved in cell wall biosynthesis
MSPLSVGIIAPPWGSVPPRLYGGTEGMLDGLARGLAGLGHRVVLFTTGDSTCAVERRWAFERSQPWRMGNALTEIRHVVEAYDALRDVDVVHDNTAVGPLYSWRFSSLPVVTTNHGPFDDEFATLYRAANQRVAIVAISRHQASTASGTKIDAVIHHGVDPDRFPVGAGDGGYLLFLGRMAPEKGAREAALVARRAGLPLLLAAKMQEKSEREYFDDRVRPLLGGGVEYLGEVSHDDKLRLLGGAVALLNPIQWPEPFGLVMIEALACGTPVLAFPSGAAPEIVCDGTTGYLCNDLNELCERVAVVDRLDRMACRRAVEEHFSTARMSADYAYLFERVVDRARRNGSASRDASLQC